MKNVRKKRFRKILRKKNVDFPEIEKEVKRLLRTDNEAKHVRYEIVNIDEEMKSDNKDKDMATTSGAMNSEFDVDDLFGDVVSSSDEDDARPDSDEGSRMSTGFKDYLKDDVDGKSMDQNFSFSQMLQQSTSAAATAASINEESEGLSMMESIEAASSLEQGIENDSLRQKIDELENEIHNIQSQKIHQQIQLDGIENRALEQRFQTIIDDLNAQESAKRLELDELMSLLNM